MGADRRHDGLPGPGGPRIRHLVVESLMLLAALPEPAAPLLDIGTGPGVPGLILKLARPEWEVVLIEAGRRRVEFPPARGPAAGVSMNLGVEWGRAEALAKWPAGRALPHGHDAGRGGGRRRPRRWRRPSSASRAGRWRCRSGPTAAARRGTRREITLAVPGELPWRREFLIIRQTELDAGRSTWNTTSTRAAASQS